MGDFDDTLLADASAFTDAFENSTVTYSPRVGSARTVSAIIDWNPPVKRGELPDVKRPMVRIDVENHATRGISSADTYMIGGSITFPLMYGSSETRKASINQQCIVSIDGGRIVFEF
jgi:hypothetical protein